MAWNVHEILHGAGHSPATRLRSKKENSGMNKELTWSRRRVFDAAVKIGAAAVVGTCNGGIVLAQSKGAKEEKPDEIGPTEDLMREHGVLNRVLLAYDHFVVQIEQKR